MPDTSNTIVSNISTLVEQQFPDFYRDEGSTFVAFLKSYYEWMEESNNTLYHTRRLIDYDDIDKTLDNYLIHFKKKYLKGIPDNVLGDKRFLVKHIQDLYRAKGTKRGYDLLFRLLYDEDVELYFPAIDIFRASDGQWVKRDYLELTESDLIPNMIGKLITGTSSGATAIAETDVKRLINGKIITTLYLSDRNGDFETGERIITSGQDVSVAPTIIGSLNTLTVITNSAGHTQGDILSISSNNGISGVAIVANTKSTDGVVEFTLNDGGSGYTVNATITVTAVGTGNNAMFEITEISNTEFIELNTDYIVDYANVSLSDSDFGFPPGGSEDLSTTLFDALSYSNTEIGTISSIRTINSGNNYNASPTVDVVQQDVLAQKIPDGMGGFKGDNANVTSFASTSNNFINAITVKGSGFGYISGENVTIENNSNTSAPDVLANTDIDGVGREAGEFISTRGFPSSDKFIQDSFYYQEFSYETRVGISLDKYSEVLRKVIHPAGLNLFGNWKKMKNVNINIDVAESKLTQS